METKSWWIIQDGDWKIYFLGSLVIIHGQVLHKSETNTSERPRHAFTFHMVETNGCEYAKDNWLQPTEEMPFPKLSQV